MHTDSYTTVTG